MPASKKDYSTNEPGSPRIVKQKLGDNFLVKFPQWRWVSQFDCYALYPKSTRSLELLPEATEETVSQYWTPASRRNCKPVLDQKEKLR